MDKGIISAGGSSVVSPLPVTWLSRADAPGLRPDYAVVPELSAQQYKNLICQLAYDKSAWNYLKIGANNELGRYQITTTTLEQYGIIASGSNQVYGTDCINYRHVWRPSTDQKSQYNFQLTGQKDFLNNSMAQNNLAYKIFYDLYNQAKKVGVIKSTDSVEVIAGMLYVCWNLGVGSGPNNTSELGTGAWAWRYENIGNGAGSYNSGRYAIVVLSK